MLVLLETTQERLILTFSLTALIISCHFLLWGD